MSENEVEKKIENNQILQNSLAQLESVKKQLASSKIFKALALFVIFVVVFLAAFPLAINNDKFRTKIELKAKEVFGVDLQVNGDVNFALLPSPRFSLENVLLKNFRPKDSQRNYNIFVKNLRLHFSFFNRQKISKIELQYPMLQSYFVTEGGDDLEIDRDDIFSNLSEKILTKSSKKSYKISSPIALAIFPLKKINPSDIKSFADIGFAIKGGTLIFYDKNDEKRQIDALDANFKFNNKKLKAHGTFGSEDSVNNFDLIFLFSSKSKKPDSFLKVESPFSTLEVKGNILSQNDGLMTKFKGDIALKINDLRQFYRSYLNNSAASFGKIKNEIKPISILGSLEVSDGEAEIGQMSIDSQVMKGKGEANIALNQKNLLIDASFDLERIDIDSIWSSEAVKFAPPHLDKIRALFGFDEAEDLSKLKNKELAEVKNDGTKSEIIGDKKLDESLILQDDNSSSKLIKNIYLSAEISAKDVNYRGIILNDAKLYLMLSPKKELMISPFVIGVPGNGIFRMSGVFDSEVSYPKFVGHLGVEGSSLKDILHWFGAESQNLKLEKFTEYKASTDVLMVPNLVKFGNLYLNLNKDQSEISGEVEIDGSDKIPQITSNLKINNFNLDDCYQAPKQLSFFASGNFLNNVLWLNNLSIKTKSSLFFDNLTYQNQKLNNQSLVATVGPGYLAFDDFLFKSDSHNLKATMKIDLAGENPVFDLKIDAPFFSYVTPKMEPQKDAKGNFLNPPPVKVKSMFERFFALPSLENFSGNISLNFKELEVDNFLADNVIFKAALNSGNMPAATLEADIYDGHLSYKGDLAIKADKSINGALSLKNANIEWILADWINCAKVDGVINISANLNSAGSNNSQFLRSLRGVAKFEAAAIKVQNYGVNNLISKLLAPAKYAQELRESEKILFDFNSFSVFKNASGSVDFDGEKGSKISAKISGTAINSVLLGKFNPAQNSGDLNFNSIFVVGTKQKPIPINISTNLRGDFANMSKSTNIEQIRQYLGLAKIVEKPKAKEVIEKKDEANSSETQQNLQKISQERSKEIVNQSSFSRIIPQDSFPKNQAIESKNPPISK